MFMLGLVLGPLSAIAQTQVELKRNPDGTYYYVQAGQTIQTGKTLDQLDTQSTLNLQDSFGSYDNTSSINSFGGDTNLGNYDTNFSSGLSNSSAAGNSSSDPTKSAVSGLTGATYNGADTGQQSAQGVNYGNAAGTCAGRILASYVKNLVGNMIQGAVGSIFGGLGSGSSGGSGGSGSSSGGSGVGGNSVPTEAGQGTQFRQNLQTQTTKQTYLEKAQNFLQPLAICITNELVRGMTNATVQWIGNGFKNPDGTTGPAFVSDPKSFFMGIADREAGGFLQSLGGVGSLLCKPFDVKVRLALLNDYRQSYDQQAQCSLASIQKNFSNFGKGKNGSNGNYWGDWLQLTQKDSNNAMGSYFNARNEMSRSINYNQDINRLEVTIGRGFLDQKTCTKYVGKTCQKWDVQTPGSEVQSALDRALNIKGQSINVANSFDDLVNALIDELFKLAIGGLRGSK